MKKQFLQFHDGTPNENVETPVAEAQQQMPGADAAQEEAADAQGDAEVRA